MQEPRRWRGLQLHLLSVGFALVAGCAAPQPTAQAPAPQRARPPEKQLELSPPEKPSAAPPAPALAKTAPAPSQAPAEQSEPPPPDPPKDTLILHVGDSFAAALGVPLGKRFKQAGMRSALEFKTASYIPTWAFGKELPAFIRKYNPDLVLITLGGNEIEIVNPEQRAGAIQRLIKKLEGRPCVWIAPPLWKKDTGVLEVIRKNAAPCRYMDTNRLIKDMERGPDKIHPSTPAREAWADVVYTWLLRERVPDGDKPWALRPGE